MEALPIVASANKLTNWFTLAGFSGEYVDHFGYSSSFSATAMLGVPVLGLVWLTSRIK